MTESPIGNGSTVVEEMVAIPKPPDVPNEGLAPGGELVPLTPYVAAEAVRRNQFLIPFPAIQGNELTIKRIYLSAPLLVTESELEKTETTTENQTEYQKEKEAEEKRNFIGGQPFTAEEVAPIAYSTPYSLTEELHTYALAGVSKNYLVDHLVTIAHSSVLPITVTVFVALTSPSGMLWQESFEVDVHYVEGAEPGKYVGKGIVSAYADLQNAIAVRPDQKSYGLAFSVFVPAKAPTFTYVDAASATLFYDIENVALGK